MCVLELLRNTLLLCRRNSVSKLGIAIHDVMGTVYADTASALGSSVEQCPSQEDGKFLIALVLGFNWVTVGYQTHAHGVCSFFLAQVRH